ncbi:hypothetical protein L3Q82_022826 [Scortum barcoo]|uniref:Uncharacterized protein n=1 Tax=Scortum barcoo TaxID=214431 RepID=A0ACB8WWZ5_9TELE|nr:hypothetical protein L3Q82_022826 [Scortum barcoo]
MCGLTHSSEVFIFLSELNEEISDLKVLLEKTSNGASFSPSTSDGPHVPSVDLEKLVPIRGMCRDGWVSFQGSCYLLSTTTVTWSTAEKQCQTHGGHLVVLNSAEELDYISRVTEVSELYWIGLVERQHEGHWCWVDGTDFNSTPTFWDEGQPDNWDYRENGEDCGQIHGYEKRRRKMWNDADCNLLNRYICETRA